MASCHFSVCCFKFVNGQIFNPNRKPTKILIENMREKKSEHNAPWYLCKETMTYFTTGLPASKYRLHLIIKIGPLALCVSYCCGRCVNSLSDCSNICQDLRPWDESGLDLIWKVFHKVFGSQFQILSKAKQGLIYFSFGLVSSCSVGSEQREAECSLVVHLT